MAWEDLLLADLSGELEAERRAEQLAEAGELVEAEAATVTLEVRWRARTGAELSIALPGGDDVAGTLLDANAHWLLLAQGERRALVPAHAVVAVRGLGRTAGAAGVVAARHSFAAALRRIARAGSVVRLDDTAGGRTGRIVRVGADHLDLLTDPGAHVVAVALAAVHVVRTA
ncbi:hypothetical protein ACPYO6_09225 [Georgenia sp. Z1344]|uniref:hypothetical protein n=1 Tax=Georgenia sp. Z1344 TaxID=3416706 RepID=UPI003CF991CC